MKQAYKIYRQLVISQLLLKNTPSTTKYSGAGPCMVWSCTVDKAEEEEEIAEAAAKKIKFGRC